MISILIKKGHLNTEITHTRRTSGEDEGSDQGDMSTGLGMPKMASKSPGAN